MRISTLSILRFFAYMLIVLYGLTALDYYTDVIRINQQYTSPIFPSIPMTFLMVLFYPIWIVLVLFNGDLMISRTGNLIVKIIVFLSYLIFLISLVTELAA